ncbi:probable galacturonosyltransferase 12 [Dioscorea cayenensis subsp. rotundata]|uniref:Hexosyltransferase n=1 Tax=Dioscorea cayennensis subsp. rotundata TaxID=55577 RepID=A0AB40BU03_DIOCR|nr:probable galacturonosyltransferase 12 [Dioscorea cayenensis subsp. rotundata]
MYLFSLSWLSVNEHISFSNNIPLLLILVCSLAGVAMQLHISPSLRHVTVFPGKGVREFIKVKVTSRRPSYRMVFYSLLFVTFLLRFVFVLTAMDTIEGETQCTSLGCVGKRLGPRFWGRRLESIKVPDEIYRVLEEGGDEEELLIEPDTTPQTLEDFISEMKSNRSDAKTFALRLKAMVLLLEQKTRTAKIHEYLYRHVASSSIPKPLHCLALKLAEEHSTNADARRPLPAAERVAALVDNTLRHFVLASDNVIAAGVVAASIVHNALRPSSVVIHVITDRKTYSAMQAWFSLHPLEPAVVEVRGLHHFDWFTKGRVPVLEAMEKDRNARSQFRGGSSAIVANISEKPIVVAAKLQALSPKYHSIMNHIRIHLPELFPSLKKVVFLDDDIVVQADLSPLWDIDLKGKVNGAVETCRGEDKFVMRKRLKNYLNFSHPLIAENFDPHECAWAYGMNVFDLDAWRRTNISLTYHHWLQKNLKSDLSLWQLGTLPPGLIAFHGHVHVIEPYWHMLGLGYQENTTVADTEKAAVIHFNGRAKPWLDIAFPQLKPLWTKYIDFSDKFIKACNIRAY